MKELMISDNKNLTKIDTLVTEYLDTEITGKLSKALVLGNAIATLDTLLNKEIMKPIMQLKGSKLGFRTDKDYPVEIVKRCFIEALLIGVEPIGNQWNIIAKNLYVTKEGCTHLLSKIKGLSYSVVPSIPKVTKNADGEFGAIVKVKIFWTYKGKEKSQDLEFACKGASDRDGKHCTSADAYNGKGERKAKHWLYQQISGQYVGEGDAEDSIDVDFMDVEGKTVTESPYKKKPKAQSPVPIPEDLERPPPEPPAELPPEPQPEPPAAPPPAPPANTDTPLTDREVESRFHFLVEKIGSDKVSAYFSQTAKTTLVMVKRNIGRMLKILDEPENFALVVEKFWKDEEKIGKLSSEG